MEGLKLLYENEDGVVIVRLPDGRYYYGNGRTFGGFGVESNQFLRFNPYMNYVGELDLEVPETVAQWIEAHMND